MGIIGLSKNDKVEILEFSKTYGAILRGMHQDFTELHTNVDEYKNLLNKYIRHSKSLNEKFEFEVKKVYAEQEKSRVFIGEAEKRISEGLGTVKELTRSLDGLKNKIERKHEEIIGQSKDIDFKLLENERLIDSTSNRFNEALSKTNNKIDAALNNIKTVESRLQDSNKQLALLRVFIFVIIIVSAISIILHFV